MDLRLVLVLSPIIASVLWTAFWLTRWGVFKWENLLGSLKNAADELG